MIRAFGTADKTFTSNGAHISPPARKDSHMEPYQYFIAPIMDGMVQVTRSVAA